MHYKRSSNATGFTLLEVAVVLIVIGLAVAGILVGRTIIETAKIRKTIRSLENFHGAYYTFRDKYNAIPGDMRAPGQYWPEMGSLTGDGDGDINGDIANEPAYAWAELKLAGLIAVELSQNSPYVYGIAPTATSATFFYYRDYAGYFNSHIGNSIHISGIPSVGTAASGVTTYEGKQIDIKLDDGEPERGNIQGIAPVAAGVAVDTCADGTGYALSAGNELSCRLMYYIE